MENSVKNIDAEKCIKTVLLIFFVGMVGYLLIQILSSRQCDQDLQAKNAKELQRNLDKKIRDARAKNLGSGPTQNDFYMVPRNPLPTGTNYDIATDSVSSYVYGSVMDQPLIQ